MNSWPDFCLWEVFCKEKLLVFSWSFSITHWRKAVQLWKSMVKHVGKTLPKLDPLSTTDDYTQETRSHSSVTCVTKNSHKNTQHRMTHTGEKHFCVRYVGWASHGEVRWKYIYEITYQWEGLCMWTMWKNIHFQIWFDEAQLHKRINLAWYVHAYLQFMWFYNSKTALSK